MKLFNPFALIFVLLFCFANLFAQETQRDRGVELFNKGNYEEAIEILKNVAAQSSDVIAFHYLGLALEKQNKTVEAINNHEKAVQVCIKLIEQLAAENLVIDQSQKKEKVRDYVNGKIGKEIKMALASAERIKRFKSIFTKNTDSLIMQFFAERSETDVVSENSVSIPIKILTRPQASYTKEAKENKIEGKIQLFILFLLNGEIGIIIPKNQLPDGLTEAAIEAAKKITFEPAVINGQKISLIKSVVYHFTFF